MNKRYSAPSYEIDEDYFLWLCEMVDADGPDQQYLGLMRHLYDTDFSEESAKLVGNDDNRIEDGIQLREKFEEESLYLDYRCLSGPCSVLEMMVALAYRMSDTMGDDQPELWFWEMMENLGLSEMCDKEYYLVSGPEIVDEILAIFLRRKYGKDGFGGLFPLERPEKDQRKVEIWYQMSAYLIEKCL